MATDDALIQLNGVMNEKYGSNDWDGDTLISRMRIGVQNDIEVTGRDWGTEVVNDPTMLVTQVCPPPFSRLHEKVVLTYH